MADGRTRRICFTMRKEVIVPSKKPNAKAKKINVKPIQLPEKKNSTTHNNAKKREKTMEDNRNNSIYIS